MKVARDVVLDLLPLYTAGEASPATRQLVEEYLASNPDLAEAAVVMGSATETPLSLSAVRLSPQLELRSIERTRKLLKRQRRLFGIAVGLSVLALTSAVSIRRGHVESFRFLIVDYPVVLLPVALAAAGCWIWYLATNRSHKK
jgi:anti-sigma factor RsiW